MADARDSQDQTIGVVGAGAMGRGIAQVAAGGGMDVVIFDIAEGAAEKARAFVQSMFERQVAKGRLGEDEAAAAVGRIRVASDVSAFANADVVVEAVAEDLGIKRKVFADLEAVVGPQAILASNTSSIRIAAIAAGCTGRGRIAGMHFFNPVPLMRLVEIVRAPETEPEVLDRLSAVGRRMGRTPVVVQDGPGFLVNLGGRSFTTESLRIASEGVATPAQVDAVMRDAHGFRMGPFELMDLTGIDVNFPVSQIIHQGYFYDRRLATSPLHEAMHASGMFGRKTGRGHFTYDADGAKQAPSGDADTGGPAAEAVILAEPDGWLGGLFAEAGARVLENDDGTSPIVAAPIGEDCTAVAARLDLDPGRLVAVDPTGNTAKRLTVMTAPGATPGMAEAVIARLAETGAAVTRIKDSPGFIGQRMCAMVANLGCEMAQIGVASPADIDTAMTLGLNYPHGPLALADQLGVDTTYEIMLRLQEITGDDRYRPSLWLRRRALLGLSASAPD